MLFDQITIVGVGLIGGSVGLAVKAGGIAGRVVGVGRDRAKLEAAVRLGAIDTATTDLAAGVADAGDVEWIWILHDDSTPAPDALEQLLAAAAEHPEADLLGRDVVEALQLSDPKPVELAREWGVRRLGEKLSIRTRGGQEKRVVADVFPAYDDDGGLLVAFTPQRG